MVPSPNPSEYYEDSDYQPVPSKRTFIVKARVKFTGRMHPLPYNLESLETPPQPPS
jgi:hypothetical protein